jgi:hypothetical protein
LLAVRQRSSDGDGGDSGQPGPSGGQVTVEPIDDVFDQRIVGPGRPLVDQRELEHRLMGDPGDGFLGLDVPEVAGNERPQSAGP